MLTEFLRPLFQKMKKKKGNKESKRSKKKAALPE
jgi:hypothetical protein